MFQKNVKPKKLQQEKQNVQLHKHRLTDIAGKCDNNFKNKVPGCAIRQADLFVDDRISCVNTWGGGGHRRGMVHFELHQEMERTGKIHQSDSNTQAAWHSVCSLLGCIVAEREIFDFICTSTQTKQT